MNVGEYTIAYRETGHGTALVLLHGFLCDSRCWRRQLEGLSDQFRVVAWDAPGAGASSDPPEEWCSLQCSVAASPPCRFAGSVWHSARHIVGSPVGILVRVITGLLNAASFWPTVRGLEMLASRAGVAAAAGELLA